MQKSLNIVREITVRSSLWHRLPAFLYPTTFPYDSHEIVSWVREFGNQTFVSKVWRCITICALLLWFFESSALSSKSLAQGFPVNRVPEDEEDEDIPDAAVLRGALPRMNRQQMEEYMYGSLGGSKAAFHKLKRESIRRELDRVNSICTLSEDQWSKLNEAIEVDIQHIESRITSLLSGYDGKITPQMLQDMQQRVWQFASSLESNTKDTNAIWHKVLKSQLTKEQSEQIESDDAKKQANKYQTIYLKHLLSLQRKLGLHSEQRRKLEEWLKLDENRHIDFQKVCFELSESDFADLLNPVQRNALKELSTLPVPMARPLPLGAALPLRLIRP